jgi:hypothetical protein
LKQFGVSRRVDLVHNSICADESFLRFNVGLEDDELIRFMTLRDSVRQELSGSRETTPKMGQDHKIAGQTWVRPRAMTSLGSEKVLREYLENANLGALCGPLISLGINTLDDLVASRECRDDEFLLSHLSISGDDLERFKVVLGMARDTVLFDESAMGALEKVQAMKCSETQDEAGGHPVVVQSSSPTPSMALPQTSLESTTTEQAKLAAATLQSVVLIDVQQPLGLSFDAKLTVTRVAPGGQFDVAGVTVVGSSIVSLAGIKVYSVQDFKQGVLSCRELCSSSVEVALAAVVDACPQQSSTEAALLKI